LLLATVVAGAQAATNNNARAQTPFRERPGTISANELNRIVAGIRRIEGDRYYGVRSIKVKSEAQAKRVTETSVRNAWQRWQKAGRPGAFGDFFAARWCPVAADPVGNRNWRRNWRLIVGEVRA
jgi:hypothetical protein